MREKFRLLLLLLLPILTGLMVFRCSPAPAREMVFGIHNQHGDYSFTHEDLLNEGADRILELGAKGIGIYMGPEYSKYYHGVDEEAGSLVQLAKADAYRSLFEKDFEVISITAYAFATGLDRWREGIETYDEEAEHAGIKELVEYLLSEYSGTGKTFIIKNWEGDWQLLGSYDVRDEPTDSAIEAMTSWLQSRIRAIKEAKENVDYEDVNVYSAVEFNLVEKARNGEKTLLTEIVPKLESELYSYSAWDTCSNPEKIVSQLNFIKCYAPDSAPFGRKNLIIGEFGYPDQEQHKVNKIRLMLEGLKRWGIPYCFYWQIFDNECDKESFHPDSKQGRESLACRGFGLIDPLGRPTPEWHYLKNNVFAK